MGCRSKVIEGNVRFSFQKSILAVVGLVVQPRLAYYGFFKICGDCREDEERLCGEISRKFGHALRKPSLSYLLEKDTKRGEPYCGWGRVRAPYPWQCTDLAPVFSLGLRPPFLPFYGVQCSHRFLLRP
jgi:hypothetical protein